MRVWIVVVGIEMVGEALVEGVLGGGISIWRLKRSCLGRKIWFV